MREDKIRGGFAVARKRDCDEGADEQGYSGAGGCSVGVGEVRKAADGPQVSEHQPNSVHWSNLRDQGKGFFQGTITFPVNLYQKCTAGQRILHLLTPDTDATD